ncbi:MAG: hypothetical protein AB8G11_02430 [Saprospiraceae bacterium]
MQYYSYNDFLVFLKSYNSEWDLTEISNLEVIVLNALVKVINVQHTTEVTCVYDIKNCMVELPHDIYKIVCASLPYVQRGNFLHFEVASGKVEITYKSYPLQDDRPTIPQSAIDYICAVVEAQYAKNAWIRGEINNGQFTYFKQESDTKLRAATTHLPDRQEMNAALFMQKFGIFVKM